MARDFKPFVLCVAAPGTLIGILFFVDMPWLKTLVERHALGPSWSDRASLA